MAVSVPPTIIALFFIQKFYLRTSRPIRFVDLEAKSPLYQHYTETFKGLATIRALGWMPSFDKVAMSLLDDSQRPFYLLYSIQRWLNLVLDFIVAALDTVLVSISLCAPSSSSGGSLGVALTTILAFNNSLQQLITTGLRQKHHLVASRELNHLKSIPPARTHQTRNLG